MIESNLELRRLLTRETAERLALSSGRVPARSGRLRRSLGRVLLALGSRLVAEPMQPIANDLHRAGASPGAMRSVRA